MLNGIWDQKSKWIIWMLNRRHHRSNHSAGTLIARSHLTISAFAENAEMVAVENNIDVGETLGISCDAFAFFASCIATILK